MTDSTITVHYYVGTSKQEGTATTYQGALRIASRNENAHDPWFERDGERYYDNGVCLENENGHCWN